MYNTLARSLVAGEGFSHLIFGLRPPLPSQLIAGVYVLAGYQPTIAVFYHLVLGALTAALTYKLAWVLLRDRAAALLGALFLAVETAHLDTNTMMYSEPIHSAMLMMCLYWLARFLRREQWRALIGIATGAGGALLSQPISAQFPVVLALLIFFYPRPLRRWRYALALLVITGGMYSAWAYRNYHYAGNFSMSSTGAFTLLFYKTVAVEHQATGRDPHEIAVDVKLELERRLGTPLTEEDIQAIDDYPVGRDEDLYGNDPQRQQVMRDMVQERLTRYPFWTVVITGVYLVRQFDAAYHLPVPRWVQFVQIGFYLALAAAGVVEGFRRRARDFLVISFLVIGYYAGLVALAVAGLYAIRYRTPYMPMITIYAALGVILLKNRWPARAGKRA